MSLNSFFKPFVCLPPCEKRVKVTKIDQSPNEEEANAHVGKWLHFRTCENETSHWHKPERAAQASILGRMIRGYRREPETERNHKTHRRIHFPDYPSPPEINFPWCRNKVHQRTNMAFVWQSCFAKKDKDSGLASWNQRCQFLIERYWSLASGAWTLVQSRVFLVFVKGALPGCCHSMPTRCLSFARFFFHIQVVSFFFARFLAISTPSFYFRFKADPLSVSCKGFVAGLFKKFTSHVRKKIIHQRQTLAKSFFLWCQSIERWSDTWHATSECYWKDNRSGKSHHNFHWHLQMLTPQSRRKWFFMGCFFVCKMNVREQNSNSYQSRQNKWKLFCQITMSISTGYCCAIKHNPASIVSNFLCNSVCLLYPPRIVLFPSHFGQASHQT